MKKKVMLAALTAMLMMSLIGPVPALAVVSNTTQAGTQSSVLADQFITYYRTFDGKKYYRIWNATDGRWETPWLPC